MLEAVGVEAIRKLGERAVSSASEVNIQGELARQMAQQEAFRVGELSGVELNDLGGLKERESAAAADIRDALAADVEMRQLPEETREALSGDESIVRIRDAGLPSDAEQSMDAGMEDIAPVRHDIGRETDGAIEKPQIVQNKEDGCRREEEVIQELSDQYPEGDGYKVLRERDLVDKEGLPVKDPNPPDGGKAEGRRIDVVVVDRDGKVIDSVEVTSETASKEYQMAKEQRIRDEGGTFVRDPDTGHLYDISETTTRVERRA